MAPKEIEVHKDLKERKVEMGQLGLLKGLQVLKGTVERRDPVVKV